MILPCKVPHHHRLRRGVLWERVAKGVALYKVYLGSANWVRKEELERWVTHEIST